MLESLFKIDIFSFVITSKSNIIQNNWNLSWLRLLSARIKVDSLTNQRFNSEQAMTITGMSNSNHLAGRKCNKNWQKGRKSVQKVLSGPNFTKYNDWKYLFVCFITCFSTLYYAFRLTKWNNRQKIKIVN